MKKNLLSVKSIIFTLLMVFVLSSVVFAYNQAPMLEEKVEKGEIPPVDERLPENPLVIEPFNEIGKYGGTWNRFSISENWDWDRQGLMYGWSPLRLINDARDIAPNYITKWEPNEDKSSWVLHFRKGVRWSDGELLTVDDFLFWWEDMVKDEEHSEPYPNFAVIDEEVMEVTKIDQYTVKLDFVKSNPILPILIATFTNGGMVDFFVTPKHYLKQFHPKYSDKYNSYETLENKQEWWRNTECPVITEWKPVKSKSGDQLILKRNPYFYAVDPEGNQLPYIDRIKIEYLSDPEIFKLKVSNGEADMQMVPLLLTVQDISMLKRKAEEKKYEVITWDSGTGAGPGYTLNHNHPDQDKRKLYRNSRFSKALSHAINRDRIKRMVFYDTTYNTTGTLSSKAVEYHRTEEGQQIFKEWRDLAVEYSPEKSKKFLNELGVVDQNNDGWRELPNGEELTLRIDIDTEAADQSKDATELVKEDWEEVGLKTIINSADGSQLGIMQQEATFDIRNWGGGIPAGANHLLYPQWIAPIGMGNARWAPLFGTYYKIKGTSKEEEIDWDKPPRERTPPLKKPPEDSPQAKLYRLYQKAITTPDWRVRDKVVFEMIRTHMEEGPFFIGTTANQPRPGVVKNHMKNVPRGEDLPTGGYVGGWAYPTPAMYNPLQYYIDK